MRVLHIYSIQRLFHSKRQIINIQNRASLWLHDFYTLQMLLESEVDCPWINILKRSLFLLCSLFPLHFLLKILTQSEGLPRTIQDVKSKAINKKDRHIFYTLMQLTPEEIPNYWRNPYITPFVTAMKKKYKELHMNLQVMFP